MLSDADDVAPAPLDAQTSTLFCIRCGYLLRGLDRSGDCPECGLHIASSLYGSNARNKIVARALRLMAKSYLLAFLLFVAGPLAASIVRIIAVHLLRRRGHLRHARRLERLLNTLWACTIVECIVASAFLFGASMSFITQRAALMDATRYAAAGVILLESIVLFLVWRLLWTMASLLRHEGLRGSLRPLFLLSLGYWSLMCVGSVFIWPALEGIVICYFGGAVILYPLFFLTVLETAKHVEAETADLLMTANSDSA